jgi:hypothetical protein
VIYDVRAMKTEGRIETHEPPTGWGSDPVSEFINLANQNTYATYVQNREAYDRLRLINDLFIELDELWAESDDVLSSFFFFRSHASYMGAIRFSLSCQVPEAFLVMRGCLENALYGVYVHGNIQRQHIWINRDKNATTRAEVRDEFKIGNIFRFFEKMDPKTCAVAHELYDDTIDYGAHPNRKAVLGSVRRREEREALHFDMDVITGDNVYSRLALKRNMQVGLCALMITRNALVQRCDLLGLTERIENLEKGLEP